MWTAVIKSNRKLPQDRPFIAYWRNSVCLVQYDSDTDKFMCTAYPIRHMHILELRERDVHDITHWMELPRAPGNPSRTEDSRKGNYGRYVLRSY